MEFLIVTGLSGAGKSAVTNVLEDIGYFCIDNMPPVLIPKFIELCQGNETITKTAFVTDIRGGVLFLELQEMLMNFKRTGADVKLLYIDAEVSVVKKRYSETRRKHPLFSIANGDLEKAINAENEILHPLKEIADYYINTSYTTTAKLNETVIGLFMENPQKKLSVTCMSFGFKYGVPAESDLMFDLRCLPNPFYEPELKTKTGLDSEVRDFVMDGDNSKELDTKLKDLLEFLVPEYVKEGKSRLVISFGCTGGKHRSVTFALQLGEFLKDKGFNVQILHRDISK
jgi:UPF0042 nucleotide-binding protein